MHHHPAHAVPPWVNLHELAQHAQQTLSPQAWAFFSGTAADGLTDADNHAAWARLRLWPRVLRPLAAPGTGGPAGHQPSPSNGITLAGQALAHPIWLAPVALQALAHPQGEWGTALAAAAQGAGMVLSCQSSVAVETVAQAMAEPGAGPLWFQLYWQAHRTHTLALVRRAEAAGCQALVLTVDAPVQGVRDAERRAGFHPPPGVKAVHLADLPPLPPGVGHAAPVAHPAIHPAAPTTVATATSKHLAALLASAPTWADVEWLAGQTRLPLWLKGVLHPADAAQAARTGAVAGLVVSNHGGRVLDTTVSTAWALPRVVEALAAATGQRPGAQPLPVLVDGGIRRGTDVLKALALGAQAVLVGRPQVFALAAGGPLAVAQMLRLLRDEFAAALALCGCSSVADLHPGLVVG